MSKKFQGQSIGGFGSGYTQTVKIDGRKGKPNHVCLKVGDGDYVELSPEAAKALAAQIGYLTTRAGSRSAPAQAAAPSAPSSVDHEEEV